MTHHPQGAKWLAAPRLAESSTRDSATKSAFLTQQDQAGAWNPEGLATLQALDVFPVSGNSDPFLTNWVKCLIRRNLMRTPRLGHYLQHSLQTSQKGRPCFHISRKYLAASVAERTPCLHLQPSRGLTCLTQSLSEAKGTGTAQLGPRVSKDLPQNLEGFPKIPYFPKKPT